MMSKFHWIRHRFRYELFVIVCLKIALILGIKYTYFDPKDHPKLPEAVVTEHIFFSSSAADSPDSSILNKELIHDQ